jgi:CDGSH-type Zn-finger protein
MKSALGKLRADFISGRLVRRFRYICPYPKIRTMAKTKITVNNNGSLRVEGEFEIVDKDGNVYGLGGRELVSICRCGRSQNKPFCDGSHKGHFEHNAVAFDLPPKKQ